MIKWIQSHRATIWWVAGASILVFIASLIIVPLLIVRIPSDHFAHKTRRPTPRVGRRSPLRWALIVGKNLLGCVLVFAGLAMLFLPGQGLVTILIGIALLDFPGKYRLERWVVSRGAVLRSINRLRQRAGRPPLFLEDYDRSTGQDRPGEPAHKGSGETTKGTKNEAGKLKGERAGEDSPQMPR